MTTQHDVISKKLTANVAYGGAVTLDYPEGRGPEDYAADGNHYVTSIMGPVRYSQYGDIDVALNAADITVTAYGRAGGFTKGDTVYLHLDMGASALSGLPAAPTDPSKVMPVTAVRVTLGAPDASDSDGAVASQACTAATGLATGINGALATDGVATFDVPRNVVASWTGTAVLTVTGEDEFGNTLVESSGSGTSMTGTKAFKTVTGVSTNADITGLTVGTSKVLGLPVVLDETTDVLAEIEDGADATPGTVVAADRASPTATTGDVRGTYAPSSNPDGAKVFEVTALVRSVSRVGGPQYDG